MIISKAPFRVSFCGGGSDLPAFYRQFGGAVLSTSINRYMHIAINPYFYGEKILLKYSKTELVENYAQIEHNIFRTVLKDFQLKGVEITSMADIPAGTGLGSSSAFTVALLNSLYCYIGKRVSKQDLAEEACSVEIDKLGSPIGKQDQYGAAMGGLNYITFHEDDSVSVEPVLMTLEKYRALQDNLALYYTGMVHSANAILAEQNRNLKQKKKNEATRRMVKLAGELRACLEKGDINATGSILHESWMHKKTLSSGISTSQIDEYYNIAMKNGATGGKLLGAGGGGFFLFYCEKEKQPMLTEALKLRKMDFSFEHDGASIVFIGHPYRA